MRKPYTRKVLHFKFDRALLNKLRVQIIAKIRELHRLSFSTRLLEPYP